MSVKNFDIDEPLPKLKQVFECPHCGKKYKSKKSFEKHVASCEYNEENQESDLDLDALEVISACNNTAIVPNHAELREIQNLRNELLQILMSNPNIDLKSPVELSPFQAINTMSVEELKARIFQAKRDLSSKTDLKISDSALGLVNLFVGNMLGCLDELQEEVNKDVLLRETVKDTLSINLLSKIPPQLKVTGLYAMNVGTAISKARSKNIVVDTEHV
jgi:hypothetical protein